MNTDIAATAIKLLNDPARTFGRSINQTLSDIVGGAICLATKDAPLKSEDFESIRREILQILRQPATPTNHQRRVAS